MATLGSSHRANVRRRIKGLQQQYHMRFERVTTDTERRDALSALAVWSERRWNDHGGSSAFMTPSVRAFQDEATRRALEQGWLSMHQLRLNGENPRAQAPPDLVNGILTNLLQNAAEAAGPGGSVVVRTRADSQRVLIDIHDSGPGLSDEVSATLFEPTITFKKDGMGLGLSIAKKNALLSGGDLTLIPGELGGAAFRVSLPS